MYACVLRFDRVPCYAHVDGSDPRRQVRVRMTVTKLHDVNPAGHTFSADVLIETTWLVDARTDERVAALLGRVNCSNNFRRVVEVMKSRGGAQDVTTAEDDKLMRLSVEMTHRDRMATAEQNKRGSSSKRGSMLSNNIPPPLRTDVKLGDLQTVAVLGEGAFGLVKLVRLKSSPTTPV